MKRQNESSLSDLLKQFAKQPKIAAKIKKVKIVDAWIAVMGPVVNQHTTSIQLYQKKLTIRIASSALRQDLFMSSDKILKKINEYMSEEAVDQIDIR